MAMVTYTQIPGGSSCGASCLMMAGKDAGHYTIPFSQAQERAIHRTISLAPHTLNDYTLPGSLADHALGSTGFSNAEIILSGNIFTPQLIAQYNATPGCYPTNRAIDVRTWRTGLWSPRYLPSGSRHYYIIAVICVDHHYARRIPVAGWLADLAVGMGIVGNTPNLSLHWILYHDNSYTDPANGLQYWFLTRMGGANRAYWDTGVYIHLWD